MQYTELLLSSKNGKFQWENFDIFLNLAQNIDCGCTLEPPRQNKKNRYTSANPVFSYKSGVYWGILHGHVFLMQHKRLYSKSNT